MPAWLTIAMSILSAVAGDIPAILQVITIIKNAIEGKRGPTSEEWTTLDKLADDAHAKLQADVANAANS